MSDLLIHAAALELALRDALWPACGEATATCIALAELLVVDAAVIAAVLLCVAIALRRR